MTDYIGDPEFDGSVETVREHYRDAEPVIEAFESLGDAPDGFREDTLVRTVGAEETEDGLRVRVDALHRLAQLEGLDVTERTVRRWVDDLETFLDQYRETHSPDAQLRERQNVDWV